MCKLQKKTLKARPLISTIGVFSGILLYCGMMLIPFNLSEIASVDGIMNIIMAMLGQLGRNPLFLFMFICSIASAAMMSASSPNWFAIIGDVNLPEHRGTIFGFGNLVNGIGRGFGSIIFPMIATTLLMFYPDPMNYFWSLIMIQLFFIPTGICYLIVCFYIEKDMHYVKKTLLERAEQIKKQNLAKDIEQNNDSNNLNRGDVKP